VNPHDVPKVVSVRARAALDWAGRKKPPKPKPTPPTTPTTPPVDPTEPPDENPEEPPDLPPTEPPAEPPVEPKGDAPFADVHFVITVTFRGQSETTEADIQIPVTGAEPDVEPPGGSDDA
jgi:hypothetical protein